MIYRAPIAIGGIGGSGTRMIADITIKAGINLGEQLNPMNDNLWFTLLMKRQELWPPEEHSQEIKQAYHLFKRAMHGRAATSPSDQLAIQKALGDKRSSYDVKILATPVQGLQNMPRQPLKKIRQHWGWKEPNTHIVLPELLKIEPKMKYLHVMRNGLDMAYSVNQQQTEFWSEQLLGRQHTKPAAEASLSYWCAAHRRILEVTQNMGERFLLVNYDQLCLKPEQELPRLLRFLGNEQVDLESIIKLIKPPKSIGRHKQHPPLDISERDLNLLKQLGYSI